MQILDYLNFGLGALTSASNFGMQFANLNYQKKLQNEIFAREDSAVSRRMEDLKKAGLNPVLAANQGAAAGSAVTISSPVLERVVLSKQLEQVSSDIENKKKQTDVLAKTVDSLAKDVENKTLENSLLKDRIDSVRLDNLRKQYEYDYFSSNGLPYNTDPNIAIVSDLIKGMFSGIAPKKIVENAGKNVVNKVLDYSNHLKEKISSSFGNNISEVVVDKNKIRENNKKYKGGRFR